MQEKHFKRTKKFPFVLHSAAVMVNHAPHHVHGGFPHMDGREKEYQLFLNLGEDTRFQQAQKADTGLEMV
eukprot:826265-Prorocentrum_minimum.AAC.1